MPANEKEKNEVVNAPKITTGTVTVKKKSEGKRIEEDLMGIWSYLWNQVIVPNGKDLLAEAGRSALDMTIYGSIDNSRRRNQGSRNYSGRHDYSRRYRYEEEDKYRKSEAGPRRGKARNRYECEILYYDERGDAETVLDTLLNNIEEYGKTSVADYMSASGVTPEWTDNNFGWYDINENAIARDRYGYYIRLPKVEEL